MGKKKKKPKPEDVLEKLRSEMLDTIRRWREYSQGSCNDPSWEDGSNMDLLCNHTCYYRKMMREVCSESGLPLPWEAYLPTPPRVPFNWMADPECERARKFSQQPYHRDIVSYPVSYQRRFRK